MRTWLLGTDLAGAVKACLARQAYSALLRLGTPLYLWRVWWRGREEPHYRDHWPWRLGLYGARYRVDVEQGQGAGLFARPCVWLHAVSLGEARAAAPLVQALRAQLPGMRLLLTHTTATGREAGHSLLQQGDLQTWLPYDSPGAVRRFLRLHKPAVGVLMETEVWPNLQHQALKAGVPMVLANARLSAKSLKQGQRFSALMRPAARSMRLTLAQTAGDAERIKAMGGQSVQVCGNVKFDMHPDQAMLAKGQAWRQTSGRPMVLAASTREGEELGLLAAWCAMLNQQQAARAASWVEPRLLIVPRHPQRFNEVAQLVAATGLSLSRRSCWSMGQPDALALAAQVWLGDSMGEMPLYYGCADAALLGGSFAPLGGQNLIEAAACGCPVVMGPSTFNFAQAAELSEAAGAAYRVDDWAAGVQAAVQLTTPGAHAHAAQAALQFASQHKGVAVRMAQAIVMAAGLATRGGV